MNKKIGLKQAPGVHKSKLLLLLFMITVIFFVLIPSLVKLRTKSDVLWESILKVSNTVTDLSEILKDNNDFLAKRLNFLLTL